MSQNPYESPRQLAASTTYYKSVAKNARLLELWRVTRPSVLAFCIAMVVKCFRLDLPVENAFAFDSVVPGKFDEVPPTMIERFRNEQAELRGIGFRQVFSMEVPMMGDGDSFAQVSIGPRLDRVAGCIYSRTISGGKAKFECPVAISSRTKDKLIYTTSNAPRQIDPPDTCRVSHIATKSMTVLNEHHSKTIARLRSPCIQMDEDSAWQFLRENAKLALEDHLARGIISELTDAECATLLDTM